MTASQPYKQGEVADWFDRTYRSRGLRYLRPLESYPIFLQLLEAQPGQRLLDVACGPGLLLRAARMRQLQVTGVDISRSAIEMAKDYAPQATALVGNAEVLPFAVGSFDYVTCIGAVERFLNRKKALQELLRVGTADARYCFMVRNAATLGWRVRTWLGRKNEAGHQDALDLTQWVALFESCGFEIDGVHPDQWQRQKLRKLMRGFRRHDFARPERVARPLLPLRLANEFIFVMRRGSR